eukprot:UN18866
MGFGQLGLCFLYFGGSAYWIRKCLPTTKELNFRISESEAVFLSSNDHLMRCPKKSSS